MGRSCARLLSVTPNDDYCRAIRHRGYDDPWLFMAVVCTISVLMIRALEDDVGSSR